MVKTLEQITGFQINNTQYRIEYQTLPKLGYYWTMDNQQKLLIVTNARNQKDISDAIMGAQMQYKR